MTKVARYKRYSYQDQEEEEEEKCLTQNQLSVSNTRALPLSRGYGQWAGVPVTGAQSKFRITQHILSRATSRGAPWLRWHEDEEEGNGGTAVTSVTFNPCELFAASYSARPRELLRPPWWAATICILEH